MQVYGDMSLLPLLPGEGRCDQSVVAVKAHPIHIDSNDFVPAQAPPLVILTPSEQSTAIFASATLVARHLRDTSHCRLSLSQIPP